MHEGSPSGAHSNSPDNAADGTIRVEEGWLALYNRPCALSVTGTLRYSRRWPAARQLSEAERELHVTPAPSPTDKTAGRRDGHHAFSSDRATEWSHSERLRLQECQKAAFSERVTELAQIRTRRTGRPNSTVSLLR